MSEERKKDEAKPPVDVDALMAEVRASVAEDLRKGVYTEEDVERVRRMELAVLEKRTFGVNLDALVTGIHDGWDPNVPAPLSSHRPLAGRVIVPVKKGVRRLLRPVFAMFFLRQTEFNARVARLVTALTHRLHELEDLIVQHYELAQRQRELWQRQEELAAELGRRAALASAQAPAGPAPARAAPPAPAAAAPAAPFPGYLGFEDRHRGTPEEIKQRQRDYLKHFLGRAPVADLGCGRGEFLELLREAGIEAYGVDSSPEMAALCRGKGLKAEMADLNAHLGGVPDASLGGIFAAQVVEHLATPQVLELVRLSAAKLSEGGRLVLETINPACLAVFAGSVYLDLTHVRPIHPEAMRFLLEAAGFREVEVLWRSPFPPEARLKEVDLFHRLQRFESALLNVLNDNFNQLNALIYGYQDYAVVGTR